MSEKHTPGPWFVGKIYGWGGTCILRRPEAESIGVAGDAPIASMISGASHWEHRYPVDANARLIAAAPELLAALCEVAVLGSGKCVIGKPLADMVRAAIAKATSND